ncbi:MAG TPA: nuclear transport factor 2 family protein [Solirubrobacteraceae bacterium]|jgi:hypothetical protein|nr:nuclear transport factor 2 family protein [Solirubrobacteraceae bacterium]
MALAHRRDSSTMRRRAGDGSRSLAAVHALLSRQAAAAAGAALLAAGLAACGETASTSGFSGEKHAVAQAIVNFQSDVRAREQKKLCQNDLAASVTARFAHSGGCQAALKSQLTQVDAPGLTIESVLVSGRTAVARVKSTYSGKNAISAMRLVKEAGRWKIATTR